MSVAPDHLLHVFLKTIRSELRAGQSDLDLRQLAVALTVCQTDELQTVRGLAKHLNINVSAVSRVLIRLDELDLAQRKADPRDRRSVLVMRTSAGTAMMRRLADAMAVASRG